VRFSRRTGWDRRPNDLAQLSSDAARAGRTLLDLTESNPTRAGFAWPPEALAQALSNPASVRHEPDPRGLPAAREAVVAWHSRRGVPIRADRTFLLASTSEAYAHVFKLLCDPGDAVMVPQPSYPLFDFLAALESVTIAPYRLRLEASGWRLDVEALAAALPERARAVVVVHPNNPTGSLLSGAEAASLGRLCAERGLAVVSDEVFAEFAWPDATAGGEAPPRSLLLATPRSGALTLAMSGLSKACGLPQLKLAWLVVDGPEALAREASERLEIVLDTYLSLATPVQHALPALLRRGEDVVREVLARIVRNRAELARQLPLTRLRVLPAQAGWYAILELPPGVDEERLARDLLAQDDTLVHPGYFFDVRGGGHAVLSLIAPEPDFAEGLARLVRRATALPA
jgi:hypothetical protein